MRQKSLSNLKRRKNFREVRKNFLIVCEGEKTEPNYFEKFRVPKKIFDVVGIGANTISLVEKAIELRNNSIVSYAEVWCVFDRDSFPAQNFNNAITLARQNNINVAYSNEAFEIWYLLHFNFHDSATSRAQYAAMLTDRLGFQYKKNDPSMYDRILPLQNVAIRNAENLINSYVNHSPERDNPSTTVHILVKELNKYSR
jgi:hypothetical protein